MNVRDFLITTYPTILSTVLLTVLSTVLCIWWFSHTNKVICLLMAIKNFTWSHHLWPFPLYKNPKLVSAILNIFFILLAILDRTIDSTIDSTKYFYNWTNKVILLFASFPFHLLTQPMPLPSYYPTMLLLLLNCLDPVCLLSTAVLLQIRIQLSFPSF